MTEKCSKCTRCCCVVECYDEGDNSVPVVDERVANDVDSWFNDDDWVCVNSHVDYSVPVANDDWDVDDDVFVTVVDVSDDDNYDEDVGDVDEEDFVVEDGQALCLCEGRCPHKC